MEQWEAPDCGTTRISNLKTLQRWIDNGKYQEYLNDGWIFNVGCGRFRTEVCTCSACRKRPKQDLKTILDNGWVYMPLNLER